MASESVKSGSVKVTEESEFLMRRVFGLIRKNTHSPTGSRSDQSCVVQITELKWSANESAPVGGRAGEYQERAREGLFCFLRGERRIVSSQPSCYRGYWCSTCEHDCTDWDLHVR
ncbi:hypothetical protein Peur_017817 [Populus x canadensis]